LCSRHLIEGSSGEFTAGCFLADTAPLFEKEWDIHFPATPLDLNNPFPFHWPRF
jgi:hypothetical protein